jgi:hypothetical protein
MPSTSPARQKRWPGMDSQAIAFLESRGFVLDDNWAWYLPKPGHVLTRRERDAITYLVEEFDWGGVRTVTLDEDMEDAITAWRNETKVKHTDDCACELCCRLGTLADYLIKTKYQRRKP